MLLDSCIIAKSPPDGIRPIPNWMNKSLCWQQLTFRANRESVNAGRLVQVKERQAIAVEFRISLVFADSPGEK